MANSFITMTGATDIAPVTAIPTTAAHFALQNLESVGGKTYYINGLGWTTTTSATAAFVGQLVVCVISGVQSPISGSNSALGPLPVDGTIARSKGMAWGAVTLTTQQNNQAPWHPVGLSANSAALTATVGTGAWANVAGMGYQLAPGAVIALAVICGAAGSAKCKISVQWSEQQY